MKKVVFSAIMCIMLAGTVNAVNVKTDQVKAADLAGCSWVVTVKDREGNIVTSSKGGSDDEVECFMGALNEVKNLQAQYPNHSVTYTLAGSDGPK